MEIGLALSGGGIKGAAHIGVIKAIEENKIKIAQISGASSGSIVACMYAMGYSCSEMLSLFYKYSKKIRYFEFYNILKLLYGGIFKNKLIIDGLNSGKKLERFFDEISFKKRINNINQIKIPLYIPAVDIKSGQLYFFSSNKNKIINTDEYKIITNGKIGKIVRSSCSFPVIFSPCKYNKEDLIDGGVRENLPWKILKENNVKNIIGISFEKELNEKCCLNIFDVLDNSINIIGNELKNYELNGIEYLIKIRTESIGLLDYSKINRLYELGYTETIESLKKIKNNINE